MSSSSPAREPPPLPSAFSTDPRVHFDTTTQKYGYEDLQTGEEFEWNEAGKVWLPVFDEGLVRAQQAAYRVEGVDEEAPVAPKKEVLNKKKRKAAQVDSSGPSRSAGPSNPKPPKPSTNIYVSNLPPGTTSSQLESIFSRAGLLLTNDDGSARIKLYTNPDGSLKGDALISYFKEGSVDLAVTLFDDTELVLGSGEGNIHVEKAEFKGPSKYELEREKKQEQEQEKQGQVGEYGEGVGEAGPDKKKKKKEPIDVGKKRARERYQALQSKLEDWNSEDEDSPLAPLGGAPPPGSGRQVRVVVLKHMFTQQELKDDPGLALDLKEDVREEAETLGVVTNVVLYDKEEQGVMTIKFKDGISAQACLIKMNGRFFGGRQITAELYTGKERYKQSGADDAITNPDENEAEEKIRLDAFAAWLVDGPGEDGSPTPT